MVGQCRRGTRITGPRSGTADSPQAAPPSPPRHRISPNEASYRATPGHREGDLLMGTPHRDRHAHRTHQPLRHALRPFRRLQVCFCDPQSPWQHGSAENTNGLLRQYLPRGTSFSQIPQTDLDKIAAELQRTTSKNTRLADPIRHVWRQECGRSSGSFCVGV